MDVSNLDSVLKAVEELVGIGEVVAGSNEECAIVERIVKELEEAGCCVEKIPVDVLTWLDRGASVVLSSGVEVNGLTIPYTLGGSVEGELVHIPFSGVRKEYWRDVEGKVALVELFRDPDELKTIYLNAVEAGVEGLIVYDFEPSRLRRIVVTSTHDYRFSHAQPPPKVAVFIKKEDGLKLVKELEKGVVRVRVESKVDVKESIGLTIEGILPSKSEDEEVIVSAHHDHWLTGVSDNLCGVALIVELAKKLCRANLRRQVRVISFTAEESGALGFSPWYWIYGSRKYVERRLRDGSLDKVVAVVNLDMPTALPLTISASGVELKSFLEGLARRLNIRFVSELDTSYCDSYSFSKEGVAAVTLHSIRQLLHLYHTDADVLENVDVEALRQALNLAENAVLRLANEERPLNYDVYLTAIEEKLSSYVSLENFKHRVREAMVRGDYRALRKCFMVLNKSLIKVVFKGIYGEDLGWFETMFLPQLMILNVLSQLREVKELVLQGRGEDAMSVLRNIPKRVVYPGYEEVLFDVDVDRLANSVKVSFKQALKEIDAQVSLLEKRLSQLVELVREDIKGALAYL
ncbi:MAG: hypothetical protein DRJ33_01640 [Candidatus Methanomethylicota archaeon]|uniref:Carboxypeptidase Q n=1 Tax=Thermoproteota archaeon TaxID=2056631 RepID=A0A497F192_9CREN|nr:MAG: hypothetical protein DRJ33_01640 [Candidatus Verstraetearchaeota archaeon]